MSTCPLWLMQISTNKWNTHQNQTFGVSIKPLRTCMCFHTKVINAWFTPFPSHSNCATPTAENITSQKKMKIRNKNLPINSSPQLSWSTSISVIWTNRNTAKITNTNSIRRKSAQTRKDLNIHLACLPFNILWTFEFGVELFGRHGVGCIWHGA